MHSLQLLLISTEDNNFEAAHQPNTDQGGPVG